MKMLSLRIIENGSRVEEFSDRIESKDQVEKGGNVNQKRTCHKKMKRDVSIGNGWRVRKRKDGRAYR